MLDKVEIRLMYSNGLGYADIAKKYSVSRQRIHQLITGYTTIQADHSKKLLKKISSFCEICNEKRDVVHHRDRNPRNNKIENLQALCNKHHIEIHKQLNDIYKRKLICTVCNREFIKKRKTNTTLCKQCNNYQRSSKKRKGEPRIRQFQHLDKCVKCNRLFTTENPYHSLQMHDNCYHLYVTRKKYHENAKFRKKVIASAMKWQKTNREYLNEKRKQEYIKRLLDL